MKFKSGLSAVAVALAAPSAFALSTGDIAFTCFNGDRDAIAFVALVPIPSNDVIYFNDNEWNGSAIGSGGAFNTGEGVVTWTAPAGGVAAGTVVVIDTYDTTPNPSVGTVSGASGLSATDESIYAYQGTSSSAPTTFLAFIANHNDGSPDSIANTGLTAGSTALFLTNSSDFSEYVGPKIGQASFGDYFPFIGNLATHWNMLGTVDATATTCNGTPFVLGSPPTVSIAGASIAEGNSGTSILSLTVTRSDTATAFSVNFAVTGGTASSGSDFTLTPGTLSFTNGGSATQTVDIVVNGDTAIESNETVIVGLSNVVNTTGSTVLGTSVGTGTITSDDTIPVTYPPSNSIISALKGSISLAGSEIPAFDPLSQRAFASSNVGVQVINLSNPAAPVFISTIAPATLGIVGLTSNDVSSVAVLKGAGANPSVLAAAVISSPKTNDGYIVFLNAATGAVLGSATVGSVPDHIAFTPDGTKLLVCNEGELDGTAAVISADTIKGTVSILDVSGGYAMPPVTTADFTAYDVPATITSLKAAGVRIFDGGKPSTDFEPEYLAISADSTKAMVTLQEANAVAVLDIATASFTSVVPLGEKDFSTGRYDLSDRDGAGATNLVNPTIGSPAFGLYMPDAIASYQSGGQTYYVTANEGDDRNDFIDPNETTTVSVGAYDLDNTAFPNEATLKTDAVLGRLTVSNATGLRGDVEPDTDVDRILSYGGRSFSILDSTGTRVFDSGEMIEMIVASQFPAQFDDSRSDNKGPEPEGVTVATFGAKTYVFVGLERSHMVLAFDVTNPLSPSFATSFKRTGDLNPEGMTVVSAADSPTGKALLLVSSEVSNTLTIYEILSEPFDLWLAANGYTSTGIDTDTDNDGLTDRAEYFFNQNPNNGSDFANMPRLVPNGGAMELDFTRLTAAGSAGTLLVSCDLQTWTDALLGIDYTVASSVVTGDETAFTYALPGSGPSAPGVSTAYTALNTTAPFAVGASLGGVRVVNEGLVGVGRVDGDSLDVFNETQGAASGLFITNWGWNGSQFSGKFQVLPDRGYNSGSTYSNYAARLHEVDFTFVPYYGAGPIAQGQIVPTYNNVTTKFTYLDGATTKFTTGLNPGATTGALFGQTVGTTMAANGPSGAQENLLCFDAEAVHLFSDGTGYVSDEYGTYIARFNASKQITGLTQLPEAARPHKPAMTLNFDSISAPTNGRRNNQGLEGISVTPDGTRLFAVMQSALVQDTNGSNQQTRNNTRLFVYDVAGTNRETPVLIGEYVVKLPQFNSTGTGAVNRTAAQSEIIALNGTSFLMLPRDGNGLGSGSVTPITFKSVQLVDFASATNILDTYDAEGNAVSPAGVLAPGVNAAASAEVINMLNPTDLAKFGLNTNTAAPDANTLNEKMEGMALVPDLSTTQGNDFFLFVANDNDFQAANVQMLNAAGAFFSADGRSDAGNGPLTNDAMFYAYRITIDACGKKFFRFAVE
jgi:hypothetical protein